MTYHDGNTLLVCCLGDSLEVRHVISWVTDALDINGLGAVVDGSREVRGTVALDELGLDAETRKEDLQLIVGAAVQV